MSANSEEDIKGTSTDVAVAGAEIDQIANTMVRPEMETQWVSPRVLAALKDDR